MCARLVEAARGLVQLWVQGICVRFTWQWNGFLCAWYRVFGFRRFGTEGIVRSYLRIVNKNFLFPKPQYDNFKSLEDYILHITNYISHLHWFVAMAQHQKGKYLVDDSVVISRIFGYSRGVFVQQEFGNFDI